MKDNIRLHGFNNLTSSLSFNIYDICYAKTEQQREEYIDYIDELYNAERLTQILKDVTNIIGAHILNIARQDYDPHGASVTVLIAEHELTDESENEVGPGPLPETVVAHLDKSHVTVHTYPESHPDGGISTFRLDIDVSTCGMISPLKALNYLIHSFDSDIVTMDYRVRGFTRDESGRKLFIDHPITSIQDYLSEDTKNAYQMIDVNVYQENMFHTKMLLKDFALDNYLFGIDKNKLTFEEAADIEARLRKEMLEIFYSRNIE
ncbi:adenosylmethionine decarboxylase [Oceanospirillum linum]|uniref:S-adenosylmethionine decarboxylase proenzyme n=1 Tax=Oceanospirillum linum TaxID=966 RepID=A0A1T1HF86_OCELI|nr:adenosylmethionine decarboxylase [Oceanospirillum linum]OOV88493.1 S-adenosylmethionine decarboxylase [Oceanospirillum linum]SEF58117.1 S-adenosylmethionine decarboxylase [Oleiphilus messinensis]SMP06386.1 S-adenosylmethionine decarboxylase [Oceanospirillum linum]